MATVKIKRRFGKRITALFWGLVIIWAAVIFLFSAQSARKSMAASEEFIRWMLTRFYDGFENKTLIEQANLIDKCQYVVRKGAHFAEYTVFGGLLIGLVFCYGRRWIGRIALLTGALYAASDELHQLLGGTRSGMWQDVLLDTAGVLNGIILVRIILHRLGKYPIIRRKTS